MRVAENSQGRLNSVDELVRITEAEVAVSLVKARSETEPTGGWGGWARARCRKGDGNDGFAAAASPSSAEGQDPHQSQTAQWAVRESTAHLVTSPTGMRDRVPIELALTRLLLPRCVAEGAALGQMFCLMSHRGTPVCRAYSACLHLVWEELACGPKWSSDNARTKKNPSGRFSGFSGSTG